MATGTARLPAGAGLFGVPAHGKQRNNRAVALAIPGSLPAQVLGWPHRWQRCLLLGRTVIRPAPLAIR